MNEIIAIRSKSLTLLAKLVEELKELDPLQFPTPSTSSAVSSFCKAVSLIQNAENLEPVDSATLFNKFFHLKKLAGLVERSNTRRVSWPVVSYCDHMWSQFFPNMTPAIFYSVTTEQQYFIRDLTEELVFHLRGILAPSRLNQIREQGSLFCLEIPLSEDANLPLYANIAHEFGHAVFRQRGKEVYEVAAPYTKELLEAFNVDLQKIDARQAKRRMKRLLLVIGKFVEETFCDQVGAALLGPAFFLSLYEMGWGQNRNICRIGLSPNDCNFQAYTSNSFRLASIMEAVDVPDFAEEAGKFFADAKLSNSKMLSQCIADIPVEHSGDGVSVLPETDPDAPVLLEVLRKHLNTLKTSLYSFAQNVRTTLGDLYNLGSHKNDVRNRVREEVREVSLLLERLQSKILPNIQPDGTLLGTPSTFKALLTASALARVCIFSEGSKTEGSKLLADAARLDRLTAKALEVTYIQREFGAFGAKHAQ